jgi:LacI family gluconate utilization system Gnt-I transcriptional repressor
MLSITFWFWLSTRQITSIKLKVEAAMKREGKWVTMNDVASEAGVSSITVSRVLRTPEKVRPKTRERIEAAIVRLGYVPDESAGGLSSRRSRMVSALFSTLGGPVFASTINGLSARLREGGYHLLLASTDYSKENEESYIAAMLARRPDGVVLTSTAHTPAARELLRKAGIPVVEIWELPDDPVGHAVGFSNREAGRAMAEMLIETGRKNIGFLGNLSGSNTRTSQRLAGFIDALAAADRIPNRIVQSRDMNMSGPERGAGEFAELMRRWPDTDAVFCVSDSIALGAVSEARRCGVRVPEEVAITGFGDFDFAGESGLGLTTVRVPGYRIGEEAAEVILHGLDNPADPAVTRDLGFEIIRRTTA